MRFAQHLGQPAVRIVVTFAVPSEAARWRRHSGSSDGVHVVVTGIGMRQAQRELRELLGTGIDFCIASGLAGSLKKEHALASVLVARGVKTEGSNTILPSDGGLVDAAVHCGAGTVGFFYTSKSLVNSAPQRSRLAEIADAVDMESFHVLDEARRAGVPAVAVRAISDSPDRALPIDFSRVVNDRGEMEWLQMFREVARHPGRLTDCVRFGIDSTGAIRNLAAFLDRYVTFLTMTKGGVRIAEGQISR